MKSIHYRSGYKYQLVKDYSMILPITGRVIEEDYISLASDGQLTIKSGYAWDGPSGPAIDTPAFMRGSLVHDALYQIIRSKKLEKNTYRKIADDILFKICLEDGMNRIRAHWIYWGVRLGGNEAATNQKSIKTAP